ncbi:MAG: hypothetical protein ABEJ97_07500 [Halobellus sp.]
MNREQIAAAMEVLGVALALIAGTALPAVFDSGPALVDAPGDRRILLTLGVGAGLFLVGAASNHYESLS